MRAASGEQADLVAGPFRARVGQVAAVLREFSKDGTHYTRTFPDQAQTPFGCGIVLVPWPNRVGGGRWTWNGRPQQLDLTEPARANAIHGLLRNTAYTIEQAGPASATLTASIYPQHGYPFALDTAVTYALSDAGLRVTHRVTNVGADTAPVGLGTHPFLRVGDVPAQDLVLTVRAATRVQVDDRLLPVADLPVDGGFDLRGGRRVGELDLDTAFTDLTQVGGRHEHTLVAPDGRGVMLWTDPDFRFCQVFTTEAFPGPDGPGLAVAVEPVTCGIDAFNTGVGLRLLEPGEDWTVSWGLTPIEAGAVRAG